MQATATATVAQHESDSTMTINNNGNTATTAMSNNYWYSVFVTTTTATNNGINYNNRQYSANGTPIYTNNTTTTTARVNMVAVRGILHNIIDARNNAIRSIDNNSSSDKYFAIVSITKNMMYSLDLLLNNLVSFKSNDNNVYNMYYMILEQRQKLQLELQFMQYNVVDQQSIVNTMYTMCNDTATYNNDIWIVRVWYAKKHNNNMQRHATNIKKMQHDIDIRFSHNMRVLNNVTIALLTMSR